METDFISELLNFGLFWKVEKLCYLDEEEAIDIYVKFCWESFSEGMPFQRNPSDWHRRWRHLDILQYISYIMAKIPRLCHRHPLGKGSDGKVKSVEIPWADSHERHSYLFEHAAIDLSRRDSFGKHCPKPKWYMTASIFPVRRTPLEGILWIVKYLNGAIDKVRRREVKKHDELKSSRYALLKNKQNLTQTQRIKFEAIQLQRPKGLLRKDVQNSYQWCG